MRIVILICCLFAGCATQKYDIAAKVEYKGIATEIVLTRQADLLK